MLLHNEALPQHTARLLAEVPGCHLISLTPPHTPLVFTRHRSAPCHADKQHPQHPPPNLTRPLFGSIPTSSCHQETQGVRKFPGTQLHLYGHFCRSGHKGAGTWLVEDLGNNAPLPSYLICIYIYWYLWCNTHRAMMTAMLWCCSAAHHLSSRMEAAPGPASCRLEAGEGQQAESKAWVGDRAIDKEGAAEADNVFPVEFKLPPLSLSSYLKCKASLYLVQ